jgi:hypothetical protein
MQVKFNVSGPERKALATAIAGILNQPVKYNGAPTFSYSVGDYTLGKDGTLHFDGNMQAVIDGLKERGYHPENPDILAIGYPMEGFTEVTVGNLQKMVAAKAPLIQKALGIAELPIERTETEISFPWFRARLSGEEVNAYAQFIAAMCKTAMNKKRVTAKPQESFENERFSMRVWLIGLGLVGEEFRLIHRLMCQPLSGNSAWRYGAPEKKTVPAAEEAGTTN